MPLKTLLFRDRRAAQIETDELRVTVTQEGGHIAEIFDKKSQINPLWIPQWRSIEPSEYSPDLHREYGRSDEAQLVAGLLGHNICLDLFGPPDSSEAAAGMPVHGEAAVAPYTIQGSENTLTMEAHLPKAEITFRRRVTLNRGGVICFEESVRNHCCTDRPIGWTQHVTLGAPFLERGSTRFLLSAGRSKVYEQDFNDGLAKQVPGAVFNWPFCPMKDGTIDDFSTLTSKKVSGGFTAHLMNLEEKHAFFLAWSPIHQLAFGYVWERSDFPWLSRWEENHLRPWAPWNSDGFALGMEFGVSPMVESRRAMVARGSMFGTPTFRWVPAKSEYIASYCAFLKEATVMPLGLRWDGESVVNLVSS
jgi:hypothetical protein